MPETQGSGGSPGNSLSGVVPDAIASARKSRTKGVMNAPVDRHEFASDNTAAICPEAWAELQAANQGDASSYGDDRWTQRVRERVRELFEIDCEVFLVSNGTAANGLALAQLCQSFHSIVCHENAHIQTDECGAPEFFSGGSKLLPTRGASGKLDLAEVSAEIGRAHV